MASNFTAEVLINTAKATKQLQAAEGQVRALDRGLLNLSKTIKANQGDINAMAKSIATIVASSQQAAKASKELADAKIRESKAVADANKALDSRAATQSLTQMRTSAAGASDSLRNLRDAQTATVASNAALSRAQRETSASTDRMGNSLSNQRYLLYDVGATYRTLALAAQALPAASLAVATAYEKSFAQVIRTSGATGSAVDELRGTLKNLATEIPLSFAELSNIAKIGGQMDIPAAALGKFTEVVAKYVATADGVTIDKATESFGRLANLFAQGFTAEETSDFFVRLGSAISYTADNSVTSEAKISASLEKIASIGKSAGLSVTNVVALSSALSSVGLPPEISRGFLTSFFGGINIAVANGSEKLTTYSKILGLTASEFKELYKNDPNAVLTGVVTQLSKLDKISQTKLLGDLGLTGKREIAVIQGLAQNLHVLEKAQKDTAEAFVKGTYLDESSAGIFNTFAANLQKFGSALANVGDSLGKSILPILSPIVDGLTGFVQGFSNLVDQTPAIRALLGVLLTYGSLVGVFLAVRSAQAFITAGLIGLAHAQRSGVANTLTFNGQLRRMAELMLANKGYTDIQTQALLRQTTAMRALAVAQNAARASATSFGAATSAAATAGRGFAGSTRAIGSSLLGLVGGPIGIAVAAVAVIGSTWLNSAAKSKEAAKTLQAAAGESAEALAIALGERFETRDSGFEVAIKKYLTPLTALSSGSINAGKNLRELAGIAGVSIADISGALSGSRGDLEAFIGTLEASKKPWYDITASSLEYNAALDGLIGELQGNADQMRDTANATDTATKANNWLTPALNEVTGEVDEQEDSFTKLAEALNAAVTEAFAMVNAQGALESSMMKLGEGLAKSSDFGVGSEDGRGNLANLQATLAAQATLLQQSIMAQEISAEQAASQFAGYTKGLMAELVKNGVDPSQIQSLADDAVQGVQAAFGSAEVDIPVTVDSGPAVDEAALSIAGLGEYLAANPLTQDMVLKDEASTQAHGVVSYIAEISGQPFEAVLKALTQPAAAESKSLIDYITNLVGLDFTAQVNADTSTGVANIDNFGRHARNVIDAIQGSLNVISSFDGGYFEGALNKFVSQATPIFEAPAQIATKANNAAIPSYNSLAQGIDKGRAASEKAGSAAKKAGDDTAKAAKKAADAVVKETERAQAALDKATQKLNREQAKVDQQNQKNAESNRKALQKAEEERAKQARQAAEQAKNDWDKAEQAALGYASRVGTAFQHVFNKTQGVQSAKDEYYTILNGINDRLEQQKQAVKDLKAENKKLAADRKVDLNEAEKLDEMARIAEKAGNPERAKYYRDEAKAIREGAKETQAKIDANTKEIKTIEAGIGNLKGYSQAAIDNRAELRNLSAASYGVVEAFAATGASAKDVKAATEKWGNAAQEAGEKFGYQREEVEQFTGSTEDYIAVLKRVPKTINTDVTNKVTNSTVELKSTTLKVSDQTKQGVTDAKNKLKEVPNKETTDLRAANNVGGGVRSANNSLGYVPGKKTVGIGAKADTKSISDANKKINNVLKPRYVQVKLRVETGTTKTQIDKEIRGAYTGGLVGRGPNGPTVAGFASGGKIPGKAPSDPTVDNRLASVDGQGLIAVRSEEFIVQQPAVEYYGESFMNRLNNMDIPRYALGGSIGNSSGNNGNVSGVIDLSAETIQQLAKFNDKVINLYADIELLASSVNNGNQVIARKGGSGSI